MEPPDILIHKFRETDLYKWDRDKYIRKKFFFERCLFHFEGEWLGQPFILNDWQEDWVANFYGWVEKATGYRRYRDGSIWIGKGGGKSEFAAGIALDGACNDDEPSAEAYVGAKTRDQAAACYSKALRLVEISPYLKKLFIESYNELVYRHEIFSEALGENVWDIGTFKAVSSDGKNFHSKSSHVSVLDEVWNQTDSELYTAMKSCQRSRRQPIFLTIGTAGEKHNDFAWECWCRDKSIAACPEKSEHHLVRIYAADEKDDWQEVETWKKANPSLGISPKLAILQDDAAKAKESPRLLNDFRQFHLNIWVSSTTSWLNQERWAKGNLPELNWESLKGKPCSLGLDLSLTTDLTSLTAAFKMSEVEYVIWPFIFMPLETLRKRAFDDRADYINWAKNGHIITCEGSQINQKDVVDKVFEIKNTNEIRHFVYDPWHSSYVEEELGKKLPLMLKFRQILENYRRACPFFESLVNDGKLFHNNPVLDWQASHVEVWKDVNDNMRPCKPSGERGSTMRIDSIVSSIMALSAFMPGAEQPKGPSVYETRGPIVIDL